MGNSLALLTPSGTCEKTKQEVFQGTTLAQYSLWLGHEQRTFVVCVPEHLTAEQRCCCVFYAHGIGGTAWHGAQDDTAWVRVARERSMVVVFLQSKGIFFEEQRKNSAGKMVWAASSWDCLYSANDLSYVETVHDAVVAQLFPGVVDPGRVFFCGYESGGMFAWPVACAFGGTLFAAVCAYNGGVDESTLCDRKSNPMVVRGHSLGPPVPVWLIVGDTYEFKARTENAVKAFSEIKWPVRVDVIKGGPEWPSGVIEEEIYIWFQSARDEALALHLSPIK